MSTGLDHQSDHSLNALDEFLYEEMDTCFLMDFLDGYDFGYSMRYHYQFMYSSIWDVVSWHLPAGCLLIQSVEFVWLGLYQIVKLYVCRCNVSFSSRTGSFVRELF